MFLLLYWLLWILVFNNKVMAAKEVDVNNVMSGGIFIYNVPLIIYMIIGFKVWKKRNCSSYKVFICSFTFIKILLTIVASVPPPWAKDLLPPPFPPERTDKSFTISPQLIRFDVAFAI